MEFQKICVGFVLTFLIFMTTFIIGYVVGWLNGDEELTTLFSWIISSICFGVCLTIILYQNGIIR